MEKIDTVRSGRMPWNKGKLIGQKAPFKPKDIWAMRVQLLQQHRTRELALINLGLDSKLRACDLVSLRVRDILHGDRVASRAIVQQKKTGRPVQFEITEPAREAVEAWIKEAKLRQSDYLFPSRIHDSPHICTRHYARMLRVLLRDIGLDWHDYGTHSMRRTKATLIYRKTKNLRAVQLLLGHSKIDYLPCRLMPRRSGHSLERSRCNRDIVGLQTPQEGEQLVVGSVPSGLSTWRRRPVEELLLQLKIGVQIDLRRLDRLMAEPQRECELLDAFLQ